MDTVLITIESHRHYHKVVGELGRKPQCCYSFKRRGNWFRVTPDEREKLLSAGLKARVPREQSDIKSCIEW